MAKGSENLWYHGRKYYLKLAVPRSVQHMFLTSTGRTMSKVVEPLSDSYEVAKLKAKQRVAECAAVFDAVRAGAITTPAQAKLALQRGPAVDAEGNPVTTGALAAELREAERRLADERRAVWFETYGRAYGRIDAPASPVGETISQAADAWLAELTRDKTAAPRDTTLDGHRLRVRAFVDAAGDLPLTAVTRAAASDFLGGLKVSNRTRNNYAMTLKCVFDSARRRGRFTGENPFADQRSKVVKNHKVRYTIEELQTLFDALPRDVNPKKHTPETAVPWAALIAAYSGACLEEICQLTVDDVREENVNGGRLWCIDIHNGDGGHKIKNDKARPRLLPMHSALVRAGLLEYIANLPKRGQLFPGLERRASKDNKIGPRVGEIYNKKLRAFGLKRKGLDFHSFRHTVSNVLEIAGVPQSDAARVLGHTVEGMTYGNYSQPGPGLIRVKTVVEKIKYEGLRI
jgi:integrase